MFDMGGERAGGVWIGRDVTKLRQVEKSLAQAERLSSLGEVVAGVAHELNNPLSGVVGYAELLRTNAEDPAQIADLVRIVDSALRCQKIVYKLLSFARKHAPEKKSQSLNDCVAKVLDLKSYHLRSSQIETVLELDPALPNTCFDFHQVDQVILNLLNNAEQACRAIRGSGTIVMRTGVEATRSMSRWRTTGPACRKACANACSTRSSRPRISVSGTGLGLSVSYGIVQEHGGTIEVHPALSGSGARFRVSIPIVEGEEISEDDSDAATNQEDNPLRGRRILVAEDEPMVLELFDRLLSREGVEVTLAHDGEEAWGELEDQEFDLVVADLCMPNVSGQEFYERVAEERPEMLHRFVFATGDLARKETLALPRGPAQPDPDQASRGRDRPPHADPGSLDPCRMRRMDDDAREEQTSTDKRADSGAPGGRNAGQFEDYPLSRQEYINVMVHFYRAEVARSTSWRQRLDATTNWAVLTTAAMLSFTASSPDHPHIILLLSSLVVFAYLIIEARRFRYFEVYRARVRMLEENFLLPVIIRKLESPMGTWREMVANDLDLPKYKTTLVEAVGFRLRRNYSFIFVILLGGWFVKLSMHPEFVTSPAEFWNRMAVGPFPPSVVALLRPGVLRVVDPGDVVGPPRPWRITRGRDRRPREANLEQWKC